MILHLLKFVAIAGALSSVGYYVVCLLGARKFLRSIRGAPAEFAPPVSILKPLHGADPGAYESLRSHLVQDYPEFEIIFGVTEPDDVAVPLVERLKSEFPERSIHLAVCPKVLGENRKIGKLIQMLPLARHEHLLVNDSDIRVPADYLRRVMALFQDSRTGMVTSLYRGIGDRALGSRFGVLGVSTDFIPGVLAAQLVEGGVHFALGATLAFHRRALAAIGGLEPLVDYLADDYELGYRISGAGFDVRLASAVVDHHFPADSLFGYLQHELRWARSTRNSRPWGYRGLILTFGLAWGLLALLALRGSAWGWALFAAAALCRFTVAFTVGWHVLRDRRLMRDFWLIPLRDFLAVIIWIGGHAGRQVVWRGRKFVVKDRKLRPA